jgi:hypothetical protein
MTLRRAILEGKGLHGRPVEVFTPARGAADGRTFQFRALEVEEATMDVHTGEVNYRSDPSSTAAVTPVRATDQGRLFDDPVRHSSFADTDQLPAVGRGRGRDRGRSRRPPNPSRAPRWLRVMVVVVVIGILAAGAALALVKTGVIGKSNSPAASGHTSTTTHTTTVHTNTLLTPAQTFGGSGSGNYIIPARAFVVTVTTGAGQSWVSIGVVGRTPIFAGIVPPSTSQSELLLGPAQISIGAGGTSMTVSSGHKSQTLTPPSAPFTYQITPGL